MGEIATKTETPATDKIVCHGTIPNLWITLPKPLRNALNITGAETLSLHLFKTPKNGFELILPSKKSSFKIQGNGGLTHIASETVLINSRSRLKIPSALRHKAGISSWTYFKWETKNDSSDSANASLFPHNHETLSEDKIQKIENPPRRKSGYSKNDYKPRPHPHVDKEAREPADSETVETSFRIFIPNKILKILRLDSGYLILPAAIAKKLKWEKGQDISFLLSGPTDRDIRSILLIDSNHADEDELSKYQLQYPIQSIFPETKPVRQGDVYENIEKDASIKSSSVNKLFTSIHATISNKTPVLNISKPLLIIPK